MTSRSDASCEKRFDTPAPTPTAEARQGAPDCHVILRGCAGWAVSHNAIKHDMSTFTKAVTALEKALESGQPLAAWQVRVLSPGTPRWHLRMSTHRMVYFRPGP